MKDPNKNLKAFSSRNIVDLLVLDHNIYDHLQCWCPAP